MGKGKRNSLRREEMENTSMNLGERQDNKKGKSDKAVAIVCIVFAVLIAASLLFTVLSDSGVFLRVTEAAAGESVEVDAAMMTFFMNNTIMNFYTNNASYLGYYSLDLSKDLRTQPYGKGYEIYFLDSEFDGTWYEYFLEQVINEVEVYVTFADAAKEAGIELTAEDRKEINEEVSAIKENIRANGASWSDWFGRGVTKADVRKCCELIKLYNKYYEMKQDEFEKALDADDTALNTYVEENKATFYKAEYLSHEIKVSSKDYENDADYDQAVADAKAAAEKIAGAQTPEEFVSFVEEYESEAIDLGTETVEVDEVVDAKIEKIKGTRAYATENELGKWLFEEGAKENDGKVIEETGTETETVAEETTEAETDAVSEAETEEKAETVTYNTYKATAYFVTKASALDTTITKDYAYLATNDKEALEAVIATFKAGEMTKEAFVEVAQAKYDEIHNDKDHDHDHAEDEIFEFNAVEKMSEPMFNQDYQVLNDWLETEGLAAKTLSDIFEVTIKDTTYYAVLFFDDYNDEAWYANAYSLTIAEQMDTWYETRLEANPITFNEKVMNEITTIYFNLASSGN